MGGSNITAYKFFNYQPEDGQWKEPKHVVDIYVINYTYLYHHIVVLDKYAHPSLIYCKHDGDNKPYDLTAYFIPREVSMNAQVKLCV